MTIARAARRGADPGAASSPRRRGPAEDERPAEEGAEELAHALEGAALEVPAHRDVAERREHGRMRHQIAPHGSAARAQRERDDEQPDASPARSAKPVATGPSESKGARRNRPPSSTA